MPGARTRGKPKEVSAGLPLPRPRCSRQPPYPEPGPGNGYQWEGAEGLGALPVPTHQNLHTQLLCPMQRSLLRTTAWASLPLP